MNKIYSKFLDDCNNIESYYEKLVELTKNHNFVGSTNEWIIDNFYLIVEQRNAIKRLFRHKRNLKELLAKNEDMYSILKEIFKSHDYNLDKHLLIRELNTYQTKNNCYFSYDTVRVIPILITMILVDELNLLCIKREEKLDDLKKVNEVITKLDNDRITNPDIDFNDYIKIDEYLIEHPYYLYNLNANLKEFGESSNDVFEKLNKYLEENNVDLKQVINDEHLSSIADGLLVSNLFNNMRTVTKLNYDYLCDKISKSEKLLLSNPTYKAMTQESKNLYRRQIVKNTKKIDEYKYVYNIVDKVRDNNKEIADYIFKKKNTRKIYAIYVSLIIVFTLLISIVLGKFVSDIWVLGTILLLFPMSEIVMQFVNKIFMKFNKPKPLPKYDFSRGIPKEYATMVVIPTIIKNTKKIDDMFLQLEKYYLSNKTPNLYFTLLADCAESKTRDCDYDEEVAQYGIKKAKELNEKYDKELFYYLYRRRVFNECEGKFLGYERKRGGLMHFNKILLGMLTDKEKEKYVYCETVSNLKAEIKYVITLDADTELVLNTAQKLVGLMAHPSNRPVLSKNKDKVISGYALVQPRVSVDIESTNKSTYSQLVAGIGGFDIYSSIIPNFYQDVFEEGSFVGKGIYDVEVFETVIGEKFPENQILSHDLLEGNYVRCGYASDIELIDDFPSSFLVDMSRQHRWTRGDIQILGWLKKKVKSKSGIKVKNPLNGVEKFKIFDNLRRILVKPSLLLLLGLSFICGNPLVSLLTSVAVIFLPMLFYLREILNIQKRTTLSFKHYDSLMFGTSALVARVFIDLITMPYVAYMHLNALFKSLYRMLISHKNLLNWITAEDAAKTINNKFTTYLRVFKPNYVMIILFMILSFAYPKYMYVGIVISICFLLAPFILWRVSQNKKEVVDLEKNKKEDLESIAKKTWNFFESLLTEENHYLIPDNYQVNREKRADSKTSPTDIGMSLTAVVSAYEFGFINKDKAVFYIDHILRSIEKLEKWNGFIYNWYNIKSMTKMMPYDISSVDNGNLAACYIVVKEFLLKVKENGLAKKVEFMFNDMDFKKLYTDKDVFSIAYDCTEDRLSAYNYNKFASESRILSFVAIAKGDAPSKHWLCLDKSLTRYRKYKGLTSWSGTSFEYFMPELFMKSYSNTLLDESYFFAIYCQREYMKEVDKDMPWGISESAYGELDDGLNYKYKAFSTPYLKVQEDKNQRVVISPYASLLALSNNPQAVYANIIKLKRLGLLGDFGFYEAYDYDDKEIVKSFFSHHQGMILASLCNYLRGDAIKNYFHNDVRIKSVEILLKEKVQFNPMIDMKIYGYKKYHYEKEIVENDIRAFNYMSDIPEVSVLSNNDYMLLMNDRGNGFSRYKKVQLNRYRKITEQDYGMFMYIKDLSNSKFFSNTYSPTYVEPDKYNVVFASDRITFIRQDDQLTTKTEIIVAKEHNAEIRRFTFKNNSDEDKYLELTTYNEPIINENIEDITHRTFKSLFISSEYDKEHESIVMCRRNNNKNTVQYYVNRLLVEDDAHRISYETERSRFIGRNRNTDKPLAMESKLSNTVGTNIDPIVSLRTNIVVPAGKERKVYFIAGYSKSREQIDAILDAYNNYSKINTAFEYATLANNINTKILGINGPDMRNYNKMLNFLYQTNRHFINPERKDILTKNSMNQTNLWKFGITGDYPIMLVEVHESESVNLVKEVLKAYEFYKTRSIFIDVVVVNRENEEYKPIVKREIEKEIYRMNTLYDFYATPGKIFVLDDKDVSYAEDILLNMVARLRFDTRKSSSLAESVDDLLKDNKMVKYDPIKYAPEIREEEEHDLEFFNNFGGFTKSGDEYVVTNPDTPTPWCNVIANNKFGTIVTNNECGFTYAYNSQMFKITSWTNDIVLNDKSEGVVVNGERVNATKCTHGFGYSTFSHDSKDYAFDTTHFVSQNDTIKFYKIKFVNKAKESKKYKINFWINPTFGPNEEKSSRYLLADYFEQMNAILIRNVYNINFSHITAFISSTLPLSNYSINLILFKSVEVELELKAGEEKEFSFMLGSEIGNENVQALIEKYNSDDKINKELKAVKDYWKNRLSVYKVKTPDPAFNYVINGWYLYQTIASRINAKAGFYQVGGAFGYRDQLQDCTNLCIVEPELTRAQIIENAKHQFMEGDVLHWWHEFIRLGLRSKYKDDFLWLVYAVNRYVTISGDYKILDEQIEFVDGEKLGKNEDEKGINYVYTNTKKSLYEHCLLSIIKSFSELGENGLPLMGGGDWNDGMNKVGIEGKGTSVWLGFFLYTIVRGFLPIAKKYKNLDIKEYEEKLKKLKDSLNNEAWDGDYYLRAFFDNGDALGSNNNLECKIDLISQSFSILSEVVDKNKVEAVVRSVEENLVDDNLEIIKLLTPPFVESEDNPGYIMDYPPGIRENGGQYTHAVSWYIMALIKLGAKDKAYEYYQMINPINRSITKKDVLRYKVEPYVIAADIYSNPSHPARGGWTWYTGSAGWFYNIGITEILGIKKEGNTLRFVPGVPTSWKSYEVEYKYYDTLYKIKVNLNSKADGIFVDGDKINKNYVTLKNDKRIHAVIVNGGTND